MVASRPAVRHTLAVVHPTGRRSSIRGATFVVRARSVAPPGVVGAALARPILALGQQAPAEDVFIERPASGQPHKGKVLLVVQAHSDDVPLSAAGTVAKLIEEG